MAEMVDRLMIRINNDIVKAEEGLQRSRNMIKDTDNIPKDAIEALLRTASSLCTSQPSVHETWKVDTAPFTRVSLVHRTNWDEQVSLSIGY